MMKAKNFIIGFCIMSEAFIASGAQSECKTLFVYHENGVEPILFSEIESIRLSDIDLDGQVTADFCVQEFCTQDTVFRFRIKDIQKVSFQNPPTIASRGAINLAGPLAPYIESVDYGESPTLTFKSDIPAEMLPKIGDKLYQLEPDNILEYGFAGMVEKVEGTVIEWSSCSADEIFESLAFNYDFSETEENQITRYAPVEQIPWYAAECHVPYQTVNIMTEELKDITVGKAQSYVDAKVRVQPIISCQSGIYVFPANGSSNKPVEVHKLHSAVRMNVEATADGRCILEKEETGKTGEAITIKSVGIGLGQKLTAKFNGSIKASGKMGVDYSYKASYNSSAVTTVMPGATDVATSGTSAIQHVVNSPVHSLNASLNGKLSLNGILSLTVTGVSDSLKSITQSYTYGSVLSGEAFYNKSEIADAHTNNALYLRLTNGGVKATPVESITSVVKYSQLTLKSSGKLTVTPATSYFAVPKFEAPVYADGFLKYEMTGMPMNGLSSSLGIAVKRPESEYSFKDANYKWPAATSFEASPNFSVENGDKVYPTATLEGEVILGAPVYPTVNSVLTPIITYAVSNGCRIVSGTPFFGTSTSNGISVIMGTPPGWVTGKKE